MNKGWNNGDDLFNECQANWLADCLKNCEKKKLFLKITPLWQWILNVFWFSRIAVLKYNRYYKTCL